MNWNETYLVQRSVRAYDRIWMFHVMEKIAEHGEVADATEGGFNERYTRLGNCVVFGLHQKACGHWDRVAAPGDPVNSYRAKNQKAEITDR